MVIREVEITNFGKLHNVKLSFQDGMNVVYGDNETGKSTIHAAVRAILFGLDRQRGKASRTDEYSRYEPWANPSSYEGMLRFQEGRAVYRIYRCFGRNHKKTEIINETTGEELSEEELRQLLNGMTESSFTNTLCVGQMKTAPGQSFTEELQNTAANYLSAGDTEWDIRRAFAFFAAEKKELMKKYQPKLEETVRSAERELCAIEEELLQQSMHKEKAQAELREMRKEIEKEKQAYENSNKRKRLVYTELGISIVSFFIMILCYILNDWRDGVWIFGILALTSGFFAWKGHRLTKTSFAFMEAEKRERLLSDQIRKVEWKLEQMRERAAMYQNSLEGCRRQLEENQKLHKQIESLILAEQTLKKVAASMQSTISGQMMDHMSQLLSEITKGRYQKIYFQGNQELFLYEEGRKIPLYQLSRGTAEQVYLALRIAAADCVMGYYTFPLLLDETFVYYDDERLKNTLSVLAEQKRQIVVFTCHHREETFLREMEKNCLLLRL